MAFVTIHPVPGLDADRRRRAIEAGPPAVDGPDDMGAVVGELGFRDVEVVDLTGAFRDTQRAWIAAWEANAGHLGGLFGVDTFAERLEERRRTLAAIDDGLLQRTLVAATRP